MIIIGLIGKKGVGKNTVANLIKKLHPKLKIQELAFADALKEEVARACGVTTNFINAHKENFRLILQGWGTDFRRQLCDKHHWIARVMLKIMQLPDDVDMVIITDIRFVNEAEAVKHIGGFTIKIVRPTTVDDSHPSEIEQETITPDYEINNNGNIENLTFVTQGFINDILCIHQQVQSHLTKLPFHKSD